MEATKDEKDVCSDKRTDILLGLINYRQNTFSRSRIQKNTFPERYGRVWSQWDLLKVFTRFDAVGGVVWQKWKSMLPGRSGK
jgi:hypothetical protein